MHALLFTICNLVWLSTALPTPLPPITPDGLSLPGNDQFYAPPDDFERAKPGQILKYRKVPRPVTLDNKTPIKPKDAWQIQFRTQNSIGEPEAGMVTVLVPYNAKKNHLFVEGYFADAAYSWCNPSMALQLGDRPDNNVTHLQTMVIVAALNQGWYVSVADDTGTQAAFGSGIHSGYTTLDSIRAVKQSSQFTGIDPDPTITMNGYSGGALAVSWASELHESYAPELKIAGAALGGLVPNVSAFMDMAMVDMHRVFTPILLLGLSHDYTGIANWLNRNLVPSLAPEFRKAEKQCLLADNVYGTKDISKYFIHGHESLRDPEVQSIIRNTLVMGLRGTPRMPWYVYHSNGDAMSPIEITDKFVQLQCSKGATIHYERSNKGYDHGTEAMMGFPGAFTWLQERQHGQVVAPGCTNATVTTESQIAEMNGVLGRGLWECFLANMGIPITATEA